MSKQIERIVKFDERKKFDHVVDDDYVFAEVIKKLSWINLNGIKVLILQLAHVSMLRVLITQQFNTSLGAAMLIHIWLARSYMLRAPIKYLFSNSADAIIAIRISD